MFCNEGCSLRYQVGGAFDEEFTYKTPDRELWSVKRSEAKIIKHPQQQTITIGKCCMILRQQILKLSVGWLNYERILLDWHSPSYCGSPLLGTGVTIKDKERLNTNYDRNRNYILYRFSELRILCIYVIDEFLSLFVFAKFTSIFVKPCLAQLQICWADWVDLVFNESRHHPPPPTHPHNVIFESNLIIG